MLTDDQPGVKEDSVRIEVSGTTRITLPTS